VVFWEDRVSPEEAVICVLANDGLPGNRGISETGNRRNTLLIAAVANKHNNKQVFKDQSVHETPMLHLFPAPMRIFLALGLFPLLHNSSL
jgi:hypothetical protein